MSAPLHGRHQPSHHRGDRHAAQAPQYSQSRQDFPSAKRQRSADAFRNMGQPAGTHPKTLISFLAKVLLALPPRYRRALFSNGHAGSAAHTPVDFSARTSPGPPRRPSPNEL
ncbi:hypothetical protein T484DRAFT_1957850 [Baffinella frigidus]|nr:hypothetical protein T484DRAFT_1957850 [Cryptophyta sp. CCMP2293]